MWERYNINNLQIKAGTIARLGNGNGTGTNTDARDLKHGAGRDSTGTYGQHLVESGEISQFMST